jgi:hypothetical protein
MPSRLQKKLLGAILGALAVILLAQNPMNASDVRLLRDLTSQTDVDLLMMAASGNASLSSKGEKPVMHTFFDPLEKKSKPDPMLGRWKEEWEKAGFETKVLTLEDAKKHPYFETMKKAVEKVLGDDMYNKLCFYRYLAMAMEGGYMSDYDTFPTNFPMDEALTLQNEGKFTSFQAHVPALISASAEEWERVAILMSEQLAKSDLWLKSDMYILKELGDEGGHDLIFLLPSYNVHTFLPYKSKRVVDCKATDHCRAVHISHYAVAMMKKNGFFPDEEMKGLGGDSERRAKVAEVFIKDWKEQCGGNKYLKVSR